MTGTDPTTRQPIAGPNIAAKQDAYHAGISERVTLILNSDATKNGEQKAGDFLYHDGLGTAFRNGAWGLIRVLDGSTADLQPLPGNVPATAATLPAKTGGRPPVTADPGTPCPTTAPVHKFAISAVNVPGGPAGGLHAFVPAVDAAAVQAGTKKPEPLALHAAAGECVEVTLTNDAGSGLARVAFNLGKLLSDPKSARVNAGFTSEQSVPSGGTQTYRFYADDAKIGSAAIAGYGGDLSAGGAPPQAARPARDGLYGAMVVAPAGATFTNPVTGVATDIGTQVDVHTPDGKGYRDFTLVLMEQDPRIGTSHMPYPIDADGATLVNYQTAQGNGNPRRTADANEFSSATYGDPK